MVVGVLAGICDEGEAVSEVHAGPAAVPAGSEMFARFTPGGKVNLVDVVQTRVSASVCVQVVSDLPAADGVCASAAPISEYMPSAHIKLKTLFIQPSSKVSSNLTLSPPKLISTF